MLEKCCSETAAGRKQDTRITGSSAIDQQLQKVCVSYLWLRGCVNRSMGHCVYDAQLQFVCECGWGGSVCGRGSLVCYSRPIFTNLSSPSPFTHSTIPPPLPLSSPPLCPRRPCPSFSATMWSPGTTGMSL